MTDTSDEACAVACMLVSNPQDAMRKDGDGWQRRVNDLIRALRDERNKLKANLGTVLGALRYHEEATGEDYGDTGGDIAAIEHETLNS